MIEESEIKKMKKIAEEFFSKIDPEIKVDLEKENERDIKVNVEMENPQVLIGENGKTLKGTERLLRLALINNTEQRIYVSLDINNYKRKKREYLEQKAREAADEVSLTGVEKRMPALPAAERRIIHIELESRKDVTTESEGDPPERHVVIKPL